jgi:hypothetical protein
MRDPDQSPIHPANIDIEPPQRPKVVSVGGGREQEQSIRARKQLLFEDDEPRRSGPDLEPRTSKSFSEYLRTTPAAPLSGGARAVLWGTGLIVVLLFIASLLKRGREPASPPRPGEARPSADARP